MAEVWIFAIILHLMMINNVVLTTRLLASYTECYQSYALHSLTHFWSLFLANINKNQADGSSVSEEPYFSIILTKYCL